MRSLAVLRLGFCLAAAITTWGCDGSNREAPKTPLGQVPPTSVGTRSATTPGAMGGEAKMALDSGNILFRAKTYDLALAQYRRSSELAPNESAPLLGILMVADVTKNAKLSDSTLARMRVLNPGATDSSEAMSQKDIRDIHAGAKKVQSPPPAKK